ncbi:MAG: hypothetical protein LBP93_09790 [Treponema sp.]|jgi:hypothetical protein|nr:hypothetical protein [Treponema sp.]
MKDLSHLWVFTLCSLVFLSCASTNPYAKIDEAAVRGDYQEGLADIEKDKKKLYRDKDMVLYYLDTGMLNHYALQYRNSTELLQEGERAIEAAFTKSISMEIGSYLVNDTTREYDGEDYEDIYINAFNALNYYHEDNPEDAMVEIRRMNNKLQFLSSKYGVLATNLQRKALEDATEIPPDPTAKALSFSNSALARYLGMLFYRGTGKFDDARIDRDQIKLAFANAPAIYDYPLPSSIDDELEIPPGKARLNVIGFSGSSPVKEEEALRILIPRARYIKIALPVMVYRPSAVRRVAIVFDTGEELDLELLENIEAIARETFKEKAHLSYLKSVIRATTKGVTSSVLDAASDDVGGNAGLALGLISLGTQIFAEVSEQADLRISRYFPAKAYVGGITLDPGVYSFSINYYAGNGKLIASFRKENIEIREDRLNLAEAVCLR